MGANESRFTPEKALDRLSALMALVSGDTIPKAGRGKLSKFGCIVEAKSLYQELTVRQCPVPMEVVDFLSPLVGIEELNMLGANRQKQLVDACVSNLKLPK